MRLDIDVAHQLGAFDLRIAFESDALSLGIMGASGSGKTTLMSLIAGTLNPERGHVRVSGRTLTDTRRRLSVPPHLRRVGFVFQEARLFPHLSVRRNLLYGRYFAPRAEGAAPFEQIVDLLGVEHLLKRRAVGLSGGEQQRVAIGRALLSNPSLLIMDEPLASLDTERRLEILPLIARVRDALAIPLIYASHVASEIATLADEVLVLEAGRLLGQTPRHRGDVPPVVRAPIQAPSGKTRSPAS